ncbi:MAG: basic amino acid ABC transporter substrate-binding protein [Sciscionella sp.]
MTLWISAALLAVSATGCAQQIGSGGADGGRVQLINDGQLGTCTFLPFKPFEFSRGTKIVGFDIDLVDLIAKDLNAKIDVNDTPFEGIQSGESLNSGACDLAAAGMTITRKRQKVMDFSKPYFDSTQALLTRRGANVTGLADLRGKKLAVQQSTTGEIYANANKKKYGYQIVQFEDTGLEETSVKTGQVDAAINDNGVVYAFARDNPDTRVATEFHTGEQYGFAVRKGNSALLAEVNKVLDRARQDGTYAKIYQKWFGKAPGKR